MKFSLILSLAALGVFASANDTTNMKFVGTGKGRTDVRISYDGRSSNVFAGQLNHNFSGGVGSLEWLNGRTMATYCSEPTQGVSKSRSQYERVDIPNLDPKVWKTNGAAKEAAIKTLFQNAYGTVTAAQTTNTQAAAFQIAVWKIGYDYDGSAASLNLANGRFRAGLRNGGGLDSELANQVNTFLTGSVSGMGRANVIALSSDCYQDQLTGCVPEPASMAALGLGLVGLVRRRRKQA